MYFTYTEPKLVSGRQIVEDVDMFGNPIGAPEKSESCSIYIRA